MFGKTYLISQLIQTHGVSEGLAARLHCEQLIHITLNCMGQKELRLHCEQLIHILISWIDFESR